MRVLQLCALAALVACACARTTTRQQQQPAVSAHITSLTDKDARHKAMVHPAFANAGRQAGVEIWRIEDFEPVAVSQRDFGKFYKGDSYIVLKTTSDKRNNLSWDIHYWIGSESSQDESGAAAILSVGLDDKFGGAAIQHRETLGHESAQFLGYFQPAIRYLDGGHASGFNHVTTNPGAEKRLFQVKGKRNIRVRQVDPLISSMNKGDVFILDVNQDILVYVGEKAKNVEKLKAISVANQIRDQDHNGRGRVEIVDQYSSETDVQKFFTALGSGSRDSVPEESAGGDDQTFERNEEQTVTLSEISDSTGSLKVTPLPKPYRQEQLKPQECYILDTISGSIYVWVGKQASEREKSEAMSKAQQYLSAKNYPSWVHVSRIPQGTEPAAFKQYFTTWRDVGMAHSRIVRSLSDVSGHQKSSACIEPKYDSEAGLMPDQGDRAFIVYRIEDGSGDLVQAYNSLPVSPLLRRDKPGRNFGELFQGDAYIINYEFCTEEGHGNILYYWLGKDATREENAAAAMNALQAVHWFVCRPTIVRVAQGAEPEHFLKMFKGRLVTLMGGKDSGSKNPEKEDTYNNDAIRLFKVYGTRPGSNFRADQVPEKVSSLSPDYAYILQTPRKVYVWRGKNSSEEVRKEAGQFVKQIVGEDTEYILILQDEEPEEFWTYLASTSTSPGTGREHGGPPRLFEAVASSDIFSFKEVTGFKQSDLSEDEVHLLDSGDKLYVWLGKEATVTMTKLASWVAEVYKQLRGADTRPVEVIKQGLEPTAFTSMFAKWDPQMWLKVKSYEDEKEAALRNNEVD